MKDFHGNGRISQDQKAWLKRELRKIKRSVLVEPDCQTIDEQIVRDLYYGSEGEAITLDDVAYLRVDMLDRYVCYQMIADFALGYLGVEIAQVRLAPDGQETDDVYQYDHDEPEFTFVCGTLFGGVRIPSIPNLETSNDDYCPAQTDGVVHERFFKQDASIVLNRRVATLGRLMTRPTFTSEEYEVYCEAVPDIFDESSVVPAALQFANIEFNRLIATSVSVSEAITAVSFIRKSGEIVAYSESTS